MAVIVMKKMRMMIEHCKKKKKKERVQTEKIGRHVNIMIDYATVNFA